MKYKIVKLEMTCGACPSQWDAETDQGKYVYIRYRYGYLSASVSGETLTKDVYGEYIGGPLDGVLSTEEMMEELSEVFEFEL